LVLGLLSASIIQSIFAEDIPWLGDWSRITGKIGVTLFALAIACAVPGMLLLARSLGKEEREEKK
jgi:hypothetical protein